MLTDFLARSDWGVLQRNRQWVRYIQAVSPFYDIIITYGGAGHLGSKKDYQNVPMLVAEPYLVFNFYTTEQLPEEARKFYDQAHQIQLREKATYVPNVNLREDVLNEMSQHLEFWAQYGRIQAPAGADTKHFFFEKISYKRLSDEDEKELQRAAHQFSLQPDPLQAQFDIYFTPEDIP